MHESHGKLHEHQCFLAQLILDFMKFVAEQSTDIIEIVIPVSHSTVRMVLRLHINNEAIRCTVVFIIHVESCEK